MRHLSIALLTCLSSAAFATVGGPDRLEVLGYEPADGKLYYLVHLGGELDEPPQLYFLALTGEDPGRPHSVRSWYTGNSDRIEAAFPARLARLTARVKPVPAATREGALLTVRNHDLRICGDAPYQPKTAAAGRAIVDAYLHEGAHDPDYPVCQMQEVTIEWAGYEGRTSLESWGSPGLLALHRLPDKRFALAVVRHVGKHFESGYSEDVLVLLRRTAVPAATSESPTDPRCARWATDPGNSRPDIVRPGTWLPALGPAAVDGRWRHANSRAFSVDHVWHAATVVDRFGQVIFAVVRAVPGGGVCVVAVHEDDFGGRGVQGKSVEVVEHGAEAALVFRHDRHYRSPSVTERGWSVLHLDGPKTTWLAKSDRPDTARA